MTTHARILAPARRHYRGTITDPERWAAWTPRPGDILVCTPPKCGTTWTQTMLAMLVNGGPDLPDTVPNLSPWIDADLGDPLETIAARLEAQKGRRVVKTHTPADGFPVWEGVTVIAVYRHPLDVFFSMRKHNANWKEPELDEPMLLPLPQSFRHYVDSALDLDDFDNDSFATFAQHYRETACSGRLPDLKLFHYTDMRRDGYCAVADLARAAGIEADSALIDRVAEATAFETMKAHSANYTPFAGKGLWKSEANFFDSATSQKWKGQLSEEELALYRERLAQQVPDRRARDWLEMGGG